MTVFDIILLIPMLIGLVSGFRRGLIMEIIHLLTFFIAIILGILFLDQVSTWVVKFMGENKAVPFIAFLLVFAGTILAMTFVGKVIKKILHMTIFGTVDTFLGAILGVLKWAFIISAFFWISTWLGLTLDEIFAESVLYIFLAPIAPFIFNLFSNMGSMGDNLRELLQELLKTATS